MRKILITGGSGQLGYDCCRVLKRNHELLVPARTALDVGDYDAVRDVVGSFRPDVVLNCAAHAKVDACEDEKETAWRVNAEGPGNLARAANVCGAMLVHVSTDYVFDGSRPVTEAYGEDDSANPLSFYGRSKLAGEENIMAVGGRQLIIRTSWLYGIEGRNFLKAILRKAVHEPQKEIRVVNDQFGCLTWTGRLALQIEHLLAAGFEGLCHATAEGSGSWFDVAAVFLSAMAVPHRLSSCGTDEYPTRAARPRNSKLENRRLNDASLNVMKPWREDLGEFVARFRDRLLQEAEAGRA